MGPRACGHWSPAARSCHELEVVTGRGSGFHWTEEEILLNQKEPVAEYALAATASPTTTPLPSSAGRGSATGTKVALIALGLLMDAPVPESVEIPEDRRRVEKIHADQTRKGWLLLRSRYPTHDLSIGHFHRATVEATRWAATLLGDQDAHPAVQMALIAALTRRHLVDGPEVARTYVDACRQRLASNGVPLPRQQ